MKANLHTLKNGLRVLLVDTKAFPSLTTILLVGAGSRYENPQNNGIAHFFEHMAFKGSKKYPSTMILSSTIESFGGVFNAFTGKDHTGYWIKAPSQHFETVVDVISDMIKTPILANEEIEKEKGVIVEEINLYEDMPHRKVGEIYENLIYQGNPLEYDIAGSKSTVSKFTRQTFLDYIERLYYPKNATLVVAGGRENKTDRTNRTDWTDYLKIIEEKFGDWNHNSKNAKLKNEYEKMIEVQSKPQLIVKKKKTEQAHFCIGFRAYSRLDKRRTALSILGTILGGGMSSRLFYEVRERLGLCYYIGTSADLYADVGNLVTQAGINVSADKVKQAIEVILKEHKKIVDGDVKQNELARAKELMKGRIILSMEDSANVATFYGNKLILEDVLLNPEDIIKKIDAVTLDQVVEIATDIFTRAKLNFALIGPFEKQHQFEEVLNI